jgi:hypothetical protein
MSGENIQSPVLLKILRQSVLELLGEAESNRLFQRSEQAAPGDNGILSVLETLGGSFEQLYDSETARGLLIRAGRASLIFLRRYEARISVLGAIDNRLKPVEPRFRHSLAELSSFFSHPRDMIVEMDMTGPMAFTWRMRTDAADGLEMDFAPYFFFGLLQEFCEWLDARKNYQLIYSSESMQEAVETILIKIRDPD